VWRVGLCTLSLHLKLLRIANKREYLVAKSVIVSGKSKPPRRLAAPNNPAIHSELGNAQMKPHIPFDFGRVRHFLPPECGAS
jgi:hypothetical protein